MSQHEDHIMKNPDDSSSNPTLVVLTEEKGWKDGWTTPQPVVNRRLLKFPDDSQVGVIGLDDILAELYAQGRKPTEETAEKIIQRLEEKKNFIPSTERVRRQYAYVLLREYRNYLKDRSAGARAW